ncbi:alpha-hydroxy-acid oxidizing enzyme [Hypericibacter adhaerens]|uniref:Alpha-hydroxy-acid oxidizing enzyme n=2 Tax=Hypericibacter adhaerens TaxID=2602016 RepID=A0A5J6MS37_9PROT|nr:alpha-hydroxy-acid oxidizing enzyme [Hypericibacter adhaerens]
MSPAATARLARALRRSGSEDTARSMALDRVISIADLKRMARRRLPRMAFDYVEGGCDDEVALADSEAAFRSCRLMPRYLVDISRKDLTASAAGQSFSLPIGIAPTGNAGMFRHDADRLLAAEARVANVPFILSGASNASIEEAMAVAPEHCWFQLYGTRDPRLAEDMVRRALGLGVKVLVVTVDVPVTSNRERNRRSGFSHPLKVTPAMIFQAATHPRWTLDYFGHGGLPYMGNFRPYASEGASPAQVADLFVEQFPPLTLTWAFLDRVRQLWPRKLLVKGILHPDDATRAVAAGADGVIVSNHGGRQLDRAIAPLLALPAVHAAVGQKAEIMLDGGIRRGSDIVIARCLGARYVFQGRPTLYGVAAAGRAGIRKALEIFAQELGTILAQIGCPRLDDLGPQFLAQVPGVDRQALRGTVAGAAG